MRPGSFDAPHPPIHTGLGRAGVTVFGMLLVSALIAGCAFTSPARSQLVTASPSASPSVSAFLALRDSAFERERKRYFNDPALLQGLKLHQTVTDPIEAFAARTLLRWASDSGRSFDRLERFITIEAPDLVKNNRKAGPPGDEVVLLQLADTQPHPEEAMAFLFLRALTRPNDGTVTLRALTALYSQQAPPEPEVWIRIAVDHPSDEVHRFFAEVALDRIPPRVVRRALDAERARLRRIGRALPPELAAYSARLD